MTKNEAKWQEYLKGYCRAKKEKKREANKRWAQAHPEKVREYSSRYRHAHPDKERARKQAYRETPMGRAIQLVKRYRQSDRETKRGECTLTAKWVVENIYTRRCLYCGESDWRVLGCDRKNNDKPHTPENVVCSCYMCNNKRGTMNILDFAYSIGAKDSDGLEMR